MKVSRWDNDLVNQLKILYLQYNLTTLEIGKKLGFTKNAIIGKIHRLGLTRDEDVVEVEKKSKPKPSSPVVKAVKPKKSAGEYLLEDLEPSMCVWPFGGDENKDEITFCGNQKVERSSYCKEHLDSAYLVPKKQVRKTNLETFTEEDIVEDEVDDDFIIEEKITDE